MTNSQKRPVYSRPTKTALLRFRCTESLREKFLRLAAEKEKDYSDILRDAVVDIVSRSEQTVRVA